MVTRPTNHCHPFNRCALLHQSTISLMIADVISLCCLSACCVVIRPRNGSSRYRSGWAVCVQTYGWLQLPRGTTLSTRLLPLTPEHVAIMFRPLSANHEWRRKLALVRTGRGRQWGHSFPLLARRSVGAAPEMRWLRATASRSRRSVRDPILIYTMKKFLIDFLKCFKSRKLLFHSPVFFSTVLAVIGMTSSLVLISLRRHRSTMTSRLTLCHTSPKKTCQFCI